MPAGIGTVCLPLGPSTNSWSPMVIFTPFGSGIGFFPTRDIYSKLRQIIFVLPDVTENFSAHAFLAGRTSRHDPSGSRQDVYPQAAQNARHFFGADIHTATRTRPTRNQRDHGNVARSVLQVNADRPLGAVFG